MVCTFQVGIGINDIKINKLILLLRPSNSRFYYVPICYSPRLIQRPKRLDKSGHPEMKTISDENFWVNFELNLQINGTAEVILVSAGLVHTRVASYTKIYFGTQLVL